MREKTPEERSALIGAFSAIVVALISAVSGYFIMSSNQEAESNPTPFIVTEKQTIREYYYNGVQVEPEKANQSSKNTPSSNSKQKDTGSQAVIGQNETQEVAKKYVISENWLEKDVGIYYSLGNQQTKNKAGMLSAYMQNLGINSTYYSIGRFYSKPSVPSKTYIYGVTLNDISKAEFVQTFKETFKYPGAIELKTLGDSEGFDMEGEKWGIITDKDIYIVVGN